MKSLDLTEALNLVEKETNFLMLWKDITLKV